jgi:hypothetical protein
MVTPGRWFRLRRGAADMDGMDGNACVVTILSTLD